MIASRRDATAPWVIRALARDLPAASYDARRPIAQVRNDIMAAARPRLGIDDPGTGTYIVPRVTVALDETAETAEFLARVTGHAFEPDADRDGSCYCGAPRYATRHLDAYGRPLSGDEELPFDGRFDSNGELI